VTPCSFVDRSQRNE